MTEFERMAHVQHAENMIAWYLKGEAGAVQFVIMPLLGPMQRLETLSIGEIIDGVLCMGIDIGYHSPVPMYDDQTPMNPCPIYGDVLCFYDGSGLAADRLLTKWVHAGCDDGVIWAELEARYAARFAHVTKHL